MDNKEKTITAKIGGAAAAEFLRQMNPDVMAAYPITPQTPIIETFAKMKADGLVDTEIIPVESEHSAMSATVGASASGVRAVTATSSQGLALMHEILYVTSGLRLPVLMYISARTLSAPINIHGEHGDVMGSRDAGWIQIFSENVQEVYDNGIIALKLAEKVKLPAMVIMDGFHTSHTTERLETESDEKVKKFIGEYNPDKYLLNIDDPVTFGPVALQNSYYEFKLQQHEAFQKTIDEYKNICADYEKEFGKKYGLFETYHLEDADSAIVIAGANAGTVKEVVDQLRAKGEKVGMLKIKLFRPFPHSEIKSALRHVGRIATMDRAISLGTYPPIFEEIKIATGKEHIQSYIYGLGGRDTFEAQIENVFEEMDSGDITNEVKFIK